MPICVTLQFRQQVLSGSIQYLDAVVCFCFNSMSTAINMHGYLVKLIAWKRNGSVFDKPIGNVNYKTEFEIFNEEICRCTKFQN